MLCRPIDRELADRQRGECYVGLLIENSQTGKGANVMYAYK